MADHRKRTDQLKTPTIAGFAIKTAETLRRGPVPATERKARKDALPNFPKPAKGLSISGARLPDLDAEQCRVASNPGEPKIAGNSGSPERVTGPPADARDHADH
jgi:hypothetical protein